MPVEQILTMAGQNDNLQGQGENVNNETKLENQTEDENIIEEYVTLDSKLDELNSALDYLEQKTDTIQTQLQELLQSNIDIREQLRNDTNVETAK